MTQYVIHTFTDPTGGGDDAYVIAPVWAEPGGILLLRDQEGEPYEFQGAETFDAPDEASEIVEIINECR